MDGKPHGREESLHERLAAVERAVTENGEGETALPGETGGRVDSVEEELADLTDRVAELEAATQALRGYVGNVRAVNEEVQERADAALATAKAARGNGNDQPSRSGWAETGEGTDRESTDGSHAAPGRGSTPNTDECREPSVLARIRDLV